MFQTEEPLVKLGYLNHIFAFIKNMKHLKCSGVDKERLEECLTDGIVCYVIIM